MTTTIPRFPFFLFVIAIGALTTNSLNGQSDKKVAEQEQIADSTTTEFSTRVRTIVSNATSESRLASLVTVLDGLEVKYDVEEFEAAGKKGKNLLVNLGPESEKTIAIGAHYDQVRVGQGAIDNACGCAALVELIEQFKATPLENHSLQFVFFDLEEQGLLGAKAFVESRKETELPDYFINVDILGYGDTIWLMSEDTEGNLQEVFQEAVDSTSLSMQSSGMKEYPPSDHMPFAEAGVPTVGVALIEESEIEKVKSLLSGQRVAPPKILRIIHTPDDTTEKVKAEESSAAIPILEKAIRLLDAK